MTVLKAPQTVPASVLGSKQHFWALGLAWTLILTASLAWNIVQEKQGTLASARIQARVAYEKDILYRRWNAGLGSVYAPVTTKTQPDPYLSDLPERDVLTPSGQKLTLMHPAYMTRQVYELAEKESEIYGHITSLKPIRPENAPDAWEAAALRAFERGEKEVSSFEEIKGREYLRLIRPLIIEKPCLRCHARQGYREGDIRGGIRVSIPLQPLRTLERQHIWKLAVAHGIVWLIGLGAIGMWTERLRQSERSRRCAEEEVRKYSEHLEHLVQARTADLKTANRQLEEDIAERRRAEEALRDSEEQLRDVSLRLLNAQETERGRISRELHDELGGSLACLKLQLSSIPRNLRPEQTELQKDCRESLQYLDQAIDNVYRISRDLSPQILEDYGISAALRWLVDHFARNSKIRVDAQIMEIDDLFPRDAQITLYRILQEALTNIVKHAGARNVRVAVKREDGSVSLSVADDGKGFRAVAFLKPGSARGLGLRTIHERARLLGGSLVLGSEEGKGTHITLTVPIKQGG